jgi:dUTP pyrophosphatase
MQKIALKILDARIGDKFPLPRYGTDGADGLDMLACLSEPLTLRCSATWWG